LDTGREIREITAHSRGVGSVTFAPDGQTVLSAGGDNVPRLWDLAKGVEIRELIGHSAQVVSAVISHDGESALSGARDGTMRLWGLKRGKQIAAMFASPGGEQLTITPSGFFTASERDTDMLAIVQGTKVTTIGQVHQSLYNPDPEREALAGDPDGEVRRAAEVINLDKVLAAGPPPGAAITSHERGSRSSKDLVTVAARVTDRGKGIGRIEWRVNGAGQYAEVSITLALDEDATLSKLDEAAAKIAGEISPRDTFVLYAAAHGYSLGGNYYMIPQDYQGGGDPETLKARAVSQERIQGWLASRIKAKRAVILLDTCESGALTGGYGKSRTEGPVSEAAVGRLHEATGRPVITAAAPGKSAYENYKGHGVFTYAPIEALHQGDTNNNGKIEVTQLAAHVERRVPELFAELKESGFVVEGLAAARAGGSDAQTAHFGSTGEDFSLVARLP
jgi:hypothetical protein